MDVEVTTLVAPKLVLLLPDANGMSLEQMVYFCNTVALEMIASEFSKVEIHENMTPSTLKDLIDKVCKNVTDALNTSLKENQFTFVTGELSAQDAQKYVLTLTLSEESLHRVPSIKFH